MTLFGWGLVPGGARDDVGQPAPAPGNARSHGARRQVESGGDLGVVEPGHVPEHDRNSKILGQRGQAGIDVETIAHGLGRIE